MAAVQTIFFYLARDYSSRIAAFGLSDFSPEKGGRLKSNKSIGENFFTVEFLALRYTLYAFLILEWRNAGDLTALALHSLHVRGELFIGNNDGLINPANLGIARPINACNFNSEEPTRSESF